MLVQYFSLMVALVTFSNIEGYRILGIFPHTAKSHNFVFNPLLRALAEKGHNVTVITHFPIQNPPETYKAIDLRGTLPILDDAVSFDLVKRLPRMFGLEKWIMHIVVVYLLSDFAATTCPAMLENEQVKNLKKGDFDVAIVETFNTDCGLGIVDQLKLPSIGFSSHVLMPWTLDRIGITQNPSFRPNHFLGYGTSPTIFQRINTFIMNFVDKFMYKNLFQRNDIKLLKKVYGRDFSHLDDVANNMSLHLLSTYFPLHGSYEYPPSVVEVCGIHLIKSKPLPEDLKNYIDNSKDGVIVFSMGSMLKAISWPEYKLKAFQEAFKRLPQNVLWKWENDTMDGAPQNVKLLKYLPQFDILCSTNVKAFITHAGGLGLSEAAHCGVPVLAIPILGDQPHNAAAAKDAMIGEILEYEDVTTENILSALNKVLDSNSSHETWINPFYLAYNTERWYCSKAIQDRPSRSSPELQKNAKRLSAIWRDRQNGPLETAIYWVEHVAKYGGQHLRSTSADVPVYRYYHLDILALLVLIELLLIYIFHKIIKRLRKRKLSNKLKKNN